MAKKNPLNQFEGPYAIVRVAGQQIRVFPGQTVVVNKLDGAAGDSVTFSDVLLLGSIASNGAASEGAPMSVTPLIGTPLVSGASVKGKILSQGEGSKGHHLQKKRRTGYTKSQGHRQLETVVKIEEIVAGR